MATKLVFVSRTVRRLKQRYGVPIDLYRPTTNTIDTKTGKVNRSYTIIHVAKAIILPTKINRDFDYDLSFVAANKNFTFGAHFDRGLVTACVEFKDLLGIRPQIDDHVMYLGRKWELKQVNEWADAQCYELILQETKSSNEKFVAASSGITVEGTP
jgi:hypothetical protein